MIKKIIGLFLICFTLIVWLGLLIVYSLSNINNVDLQKPLQDETCIISTDQKFMSLDKAQEALRTKKYADAIKFTDEILESYSIKAQHMQSSLKEYAWESKEKIMSYEALNAIALALLVKGKAYLFLGDHGKAKKALKDLIDNYYYGQCFLSSGMFTKPAEEAQTLLDGIKNEAI